MTDRPPDPDNYDHTGVRPTADRPPSTPRWVKAFGIIVLALVLLFVARVLVGGEHGPGRHAASGDAGGQAPSSSVMEAHAPPGGVRA